MIYHYTKYIGYWCGSRPQSHCSKTSSRFSEIATTRIRKHFQEGSTIITVWRKFQNQIFTGLFVSNAYSFQQFWTTQSLTSRSSLWNTAEPTVLLLTFKLIAASHFLQQLFCLLPFPHPCLPLAYCVRHSIAILQEASLAELHNNNQKEGKVQF